MNTFFASPVDGAPLSTWLIAALLTGGAAALTALLKYPLRGVPHPRKFFPKLLELLNPALVGAVVGYFAFRGLPLPGSVPQWLLAGAITAGALQGAIWASMISVRTMNRRLETLATQGLKEIERVKAAAPIRLRSGVERLVLWLIAILIGLSTVPNIDLGALFTGLGVAGIVVALALQSTLGDVFSSLLIKIDRPFEPGQLVRMGQLRGRVEHVGLKTTRIRSRTGEELIFPNTSMLNQPLRNFGNRSERRIFIVYHVHHETPYEKLMLVPQIIEEAVRRQETVTFSRVFLIEISPLGYHFRLRYVVNTGAIAVYAAAANAINMEIIRRFNEEGIRFAFAESVAWQGGLQELMDEDPEPISGR